MSSRIRAALKAHLWKTAFASRARSTSMSTASFATTESSANSAKLAILALTRSASLAQSDSVPNAKIAQLVAACLALQASL